MKVPELGKPDALPIAVLFLLWLAVWLPRLYGPIDLRDDASTYYTLGRSLAEGRGYRLLSEPGDIVSVQYPPLLPLTVAGVMRASGTSAPLVAGSRLRIIYFIASGLYLLAAYRLIRNVMDPTASLLLAATLGFSYLSFLYISDTLHSELPFALVTVLFLLWHRRGTGPLHDAIAGGLAGAAYLLRTAGIALVAAWILESILGRRLKEAAFRAAIVAMPIALWQLQIHRVVTSESFDVSAYPYQRAAYNHPNVSYTVNARLKEPFRPEAGSATLGDLVARPIRALPAMPLALGETVWVPTSAAPYLASEAHRAFGLPLPAGWDEQSELLLSLCLVLTGGLIFFGVAHLRRREPFLVLYFLLSIAMITLTPWDKAFNRYLTPLTPLSLLFLAAGLSACTRWLAGFREQDVRLLAAVGAVPLAAMLLVQVIYAGGLLRYLPPVSFYSDHGKELRYRLLTYEPPWHALDSAFEYVRTHARPGDVLATSDPHLAYLRTGHKAVMPPFEPDHRRANNLLDAVPAAYVVLDSLSLGISQRYTAPAVTARPDLWRLVFATPDKQAMVYERVR